MSSIELMKYRFAEGEPMERRKTGPVARNVVSQDEVAFDPVGFLSLGELVSIVPGDFIAAPCAASHMDLRSNGREIKMAPRWVLPRPLLSYL